MTSPPPARFAITRRGDGFDIIYGWRNSSFHGSASLPTVGGAVLLVAMSELQNAYEGTRAEAIRYRFRTSWSEPRFLPPSVVLLSAVRLKPRCEVGRPRDPTALRAPVRPLMSSCLEPPPRSDPGQRRRRLGHQPHRCAQSHPEAQSRSLDPAQRLAALRDSPGHAAPRQGTSRSRLTSQSSPTLPA